MSEKPTLEGLLKFMAISAKNSKREEMLRMDECMTKIKKTLKESGVETEKVLITLLTNDGGFIVGRSRDVRLTDALGMLDLARHEILEA